MWLRNKKDPEKDKIVVASTSNNQETALTGKIDQVYQSDFSEADREVFARKIEEFKRGRGRPKKQAIVPSQLVNKIDFVLSGGDDLTNSPLLIHNDTDDSEAESLGEEFDSIASRLHSTEITVIPAPDTPENVSDSTASEEGKMTEHKLHPEEIKSLIPLFDDTDMSVDIWIRKIKALQTSLQWSSALTLLYATSRLSGIPELWFSDVAVTTFDDFEAKITEEFQRKVSLAEVHSNLRLMAKKKDETMYYFAYRVRKYAKQFEVDDKDVVTYVVNGLAGENIYSSISLLRFKDFKDLVEVLKTHEANQKLRAQSKPVVEEEASYQPRCYNCNEVGHIALKCDKPLKRKCEKCGSTGHNKEACKKEETEKTKVVHVIQKIVTDPDINIDLSDTGTKMELNRDGTVEASIVLGSKVTVQKVLLDTGSSVSLISESLIKAAEIEVDKGECSKFYGINQTVLNVKGKVHGLAICNNKSFPVSLYVVADGTSNHPVIFGRDFLQSNGIENVQIRLLDEIAEKEEIPQNGHTSIIDNTIKLKPTQDINEEEPKAIKEPKQEAFVIHAPDKLSSSKYQYNSKVKYKKSLILANDNDQIQQFLQVRHQEKPAIPTSNSQSIGYKIFGERFKEAFNEEDSSSIDSKAGSSRVNRGRLSGQDERAVVFN